MKPNVSLTIASLLSILLLTLHLADDIVRGMSAGGVVNMVGVLIFVTWLYGTLVLAERRSGYIVMLLGGLFGAAVPVIHMRGTGLGGAIAQSSGGFFFIWILIALGVTGSFAFILSARGLGSRPRLLARPLAGRAASTGCVDDAGSSSPRGRGPRGRWSDPGAS